MGQPCPQAPVGGLDPGWDPGNPVLGRVMLPCSHALQKGILYYFWSCQFFGTNLLLKRLPGASSELVVWVTNIK